ncbi:MAG: adenylate kinase [Thermosphaera sp.]
MVVLKIIMIGAPGAGKGTYAQYLRDKYCIPHISTGDIFREEIRKGTDLGLIAKQYMDRGELVPDEIVIEIVKNRLREKDVEKGFILDGFPRTLNQAIALEKVIPVDAVIHVMVSEEVAVRRLSGRVICPVCGRVYNIYFEPKPKNNGLCDVDGSKLVRRPDDEPEIVRNRYRVFYQTFTPILDYYKERRKLIEINGEGGISFVVPLLEKVLRENGVLKLKPCREDLQYA